MCGRSSSPHAAASFASSFGVERRHAVDRKQSVLLGERHDESLAQDVDVQQVADANTDARRAVRVGRSDPALGGANRRAAGRGLARSVERHVVGHDHVRRVAEAQLVGRDPALAQPGHLLEQRPRVDHDARADHRGDVRMQHATRHEVELEHLFADDDGVAGVVAALVADDHRYAVGQQIGGLALAFVAPLEAANHRRRH